MKITILNQHTNNFGDEIAGKSLIDLLNEKFNYPEINIIYNGDGTINCDYKNVIHRVTYKLKNMGYINIILKLIFHKYKGNKTMKDYDDLMKSSDVIFIAPCGANIGIYKDWRFLVRILFAIFAGKRPIFYLNTIGKSGNLIFDKIATYVLKNSEINVREQASYEYISSLKLKCKLGVDTAFQFKYSSNLKKDEKKIGIVFSDISKHKNFKKMDTESLIKDSIIPQIIDFARDKKMNITIIPHLNTEEESVFLEDLLKNIKEKHSFNNIKIAKLLNEYDYYDEISTSKLVIGMRYHTLVVSLLSNTPFLGLAYENKMVEVCNYTNTEEFLIKLYEKFDSNEIIEKLDQIYVNDEKISKKINDNVSKIKEKVLIPIEGMIKNEK